MLRKIIGFIKRKKFLLSKFKENQTYFRPGEYIFDDTLMFIYRKDELTYTKSMELFKSRKIFHNSLKNIFVQLIKKVFFNKSFIISNKDESKFKGSAFFIGIDRASNGKIFDFENHWKGNSRIAKIKNHSLRFE